MIQIGYPKNINEFNEEYTKVFKITNNSWYSFMKNIDCCTKRIFKIYKIESLNDLVIAPFDVLFKIYNVFPQKKVEKDNSNKKVKSEYESLFDYEKYQPEISSFFMNYNKELNLKTCYFCNIDFINVFATRFDNIEYKVVLDVIKAKKYDDLILLDGIGDARAKRIINENINTIAEVEKMGGKGIKKVKDTDIRKIDFKSQKNHFTLDHFLPKSKCPILALSLYNFVPSCSSCNTKFKTIENLEKNYLSPTSKDFSVEKDVRFKAYYTDKVKKNKLVLEMKYPKNKDYEKYIKAFELENRYRFHEHEALKLIEKQEKYSETRLNEIAEILKISSHQVKKDIFGEELFDGDIQDKSFTKMKRDVARNIGIKGVKE